MLGTAQQAAGIAGSHENTCHICVFPHLKFAVSMGGNGGFLPWPLDLDNWQY